MKPLISRTPTLMISPTVKKKMDYLVSLSDKEISWHGFIQKKDENTYFWYDIILYPQYNTGATSTSDEDEYTEWLIRQMDFDNFEDMRIHGHSHVNMACTPSGTDNAFRRNIIANVKDGDFYFFLITNKKGDYTLELYDYESKICYETKDITLVVGTIEEFDKAKSWAEAAIRNNVRERNFQRCLTTSNPKSSSTPIDLKDKSTSSDAVQWEDPLQKFFAGLV